MELQDLKFELLGFDLTLVRYFLTMPQFFPFGMRLSYFSIAVDETPGPRQFVEEFV